MTVPFNTPSLPILMMCDSLNCLCHSAQLNMPPRSQSASQRKAKRTKPSVTKLNTNPNQTSLSQKRFNPLTAVGVFHRLNLLPCLCDIQFNLQNERFLSPPEPLHWKHRENAKIIGFLSDEETSVYEGHFGTVFLFVCRDLH